MSIGSFFWYAAPAIPIITRGVVSLKFRRYMAEIMPEEENDRDTHTTYILALAGFSFSALLALVVVDSQVKKQMDLNVPIFYLLASFLCYYFALNLQGYKFRRWHDQIGDALIDSAGLSLMLSVAHVALKTSYGIWIAVVAFAVWLVDHGIRILLISQALKVQAKIKKTKPIIAKIKN